MFSIYGDRAKYCDGLTRGSFLKIGGLALADMSLVEILRAEARAGRPQYLVDHAEPLPELV
ncbi:MAG TPA: hypothetical protein VF278_15810 [Pirellulales bacterium]